MTLTTPYWLLSCVFLLSFVKSLPTLCLVATHRITFSVDPYVMFILATAHIWELFSLFIMLNPVVVRIVQFSPSRQLRGYILGCMSISPDNLYTCLLHSLQWIRVFTIFASQDTFGSEYHVSIPSMICVFITNLVWHVVAGLLPWWCRGLLWLTDFYVSFLHFSHVGRERVGYESYLDGGSYMNLYNVRLSYAQPRLAASFTLK